MKVMITFFLVINFLQIFLAQKKDVPEYADLVFLVDSSNSLGDKVFSQVKSFISKIVTSLAVGTDKYRIGLAQYNDDVDVAFMLNSYKARNPVLSHIKNKFVFQGGSLKTGNALTKVHERFFRGLNGRDKDKYPPILVVITAGTSVDDVRSPAVALQSDGVNIIALGLQTASVPQLEAMSTSKSLAFHKSNVRELSTFSKDMLNAIQDVVQNKYKVPAHQETTVKYITPIITPTTVPFIGNINATIKPRSCQQSLRADIAFLVDTSRGTEAESVKEFLRMIISDLEISNSCIHFGLVTYSNVSELVTSFNEGKNKSFVIQLIDNMYPVEEDIVNTGAAINFTRDVVFDVKASRKNEGISQIAVLITHSSSADNVTNAGILLRKRNVRVFTIGIAKANKTQLYEIASDPFNRYSSYSHTFANLSTQADILLKKIRNEIDYHTYAEPGITTRIKSGCLDTEEADIYLLIDGSGSIQPNDFLDMKKFLQQLIDMFDIGPKKVRVGAVQYSDIRRLEFEINTQYRKTNLKLAIQNIRQLGGGTNTGEAIKFIHELIINPQNARARHVPVSLIVLTDGESQDSVKEISELVRSNKIIVYAIGVKEANETQLLEIAGDSKRVHYVKDFNSLKNVKNVIAQQICENQACQNMEADVMFLVDSSGSIGAENFNKMKAFMKDLVNKTEVGRDKVQFGVVQFSDTSKEEFQLNKYLTKSEIWNAIDNMGYFGKTTYTGNALKFVSDFFTAFKGARKNVKKILILITDGEAHDDVKPPADSLRNSGVIIYSVGIFKANKTQLIEISGTHDRVSYIESFDILKTIEDDLFFGICSPYEFTDECKKIEKADIVFVIDSSGSIDDTEYDLMKNFIISFVNKSDIGPDNVQIGALKYSDHPHHLFYLNHHKSKQSIINAIENDNVINGNTYTARALSYSESFFTGQHGSRRRKEVPQILVILTDGESHDHDKLNETSRQLQDSGIIMYAIGIERAKTDELVTMAGSKGKWFLVSNFSGLSDIFQNVSADLCNVTVCEITQADVVFLIDGSTSISDKDFNETKSFVQSVVNDLDIGFNKVRVGIAQYSHGYQVHFTLEEYSEKDVIKKQIDGITQITGNTHIGAALEKTGENLFNSSVQSHIRDDVPQLLLVITDGQSQDKVEKPALDLRNKGIVIHAVGVGSMAHDQLLQIAGSSENKYTIDNFSELRSLKSKIVKNICTEKLGTCAIDIVVGFDISTLTKDQNLFHGQPHLKNVLPDILQKIASSTSASCDRGGKPQISIAFYVGNATVSNSIFHIYTQDLFKELTTTDINGPSFLTSLALQASWDIFQNKNAKKGKMLLMLTDGLDEDIEKLRLAAMDLQNKGLNALVTVALERTTNFDDIRHIEFGRGYEYMNQMTIGMPDIGVRLARQVSRVLEKSCCCIFCKCTGDHGSPGAHGIAGQKGIPGLKGHQGHNGEEGEGGERGLPGPSGEPGIKGFQGQKGPKGDRGITGDKNDHGEPGINGIPGEQGNVGLPGSKGEKGHAGEAGRPGLRGIPGDRGSKGLRGDHGVPGVANINAGPKGYKGDPGVEGESGIQGPPGTSGSRGAGNLPGERGVSGQKGIKGDPGEKGDQGDEGIRGPEGSKGGQGTMGDRGNNGPRGIPGGFGVAGGDGDPGKLGIKGKKGEPGDPGVKGSPGQAGQRGTEGESGRPGYGAPGKKGAKGQVGFRGNSGVKGTQGDPGINGVRGPHGVPGASVSSGKPGEPGDRGRPGPEGRRGKKGSKGLTSLSPCDLIEYVRDKCACSQGKPACPAYPTELVVALDMANDVTPAIYNRMINIVTDILNDITIRQSNCPVGARVAVVSYNSNVKYHIRFSDFQSKEKLITAVKNIALEKTSRGRDIGNGMRFVARNIFKRSLKGATVRKIALFFISGRSEDVTSINTAVMEYSALGVIPAIIAFNPAPVLKRAFTMDTTGTFQLLDIPADVDYKPLIKSLQLCTLCFDRCKPDTVCIENKSNLPKSYMDVVFILDSSYNVKRGEFEAAKSVITTMIDEFEIASQPETSNTGDRVAIVSHSPPGFTSRDQGKPHVEFDLLAHSTKSLMKRHIQENTHQLNGPPSLGFTLKWTIDNMVSKAPNLRKHKVIIIISAGETSQWDKQMLSEASLKAKCQGYVLFVLSMGSSYNSTELEEIISTPLDYHLLQLGRIHKPDLEYAVGFMQPFFISIRRAINKYPPAELKSRCSRLSSTGSGRNTRQLLSEDVTGELGWSDVQLAHPTQEHWISKDQRGDLISLGAFTAQYLIGRQQEVKEKQNEIPT